MPTVDLQAVTSGTQWLKDRKGRALRTEDITHYQRIIVALQETIRLMQQIDAAIPGWRLK
jgi:hypothetical protein